MDSLRSIYVRHGSDKRGWYKKEKSGKCPDSDETVSVASAYWHEFGCTPFNQPFAKKMKGNAAKTCASQRMAEMKHCIENGKCADNGHVFPITAAYTLGKQCLQGSGHEEEQYKTEFKRWYDELIAGSPPTHTLFQHTLSSSEHYPLEYYDIDTHHGIQHAKTERLILTLSTPTKNHR